jgi:hypothetical protein
MQSQLLRRQKKEDGEFEASLGKVMKPYHKNKKQARHSGSCL